MDIGGRHGSAVDGVASGVGLADAMNCLAVRVPMVSSRVRVAPWSPKNDENRH